MHARKIVTVHFVIDVIGEKLTLWQTRNCTKGKERKKKEQGRRREEKEKKNYVYVRRASRRVIYNHMYMYLYMYRRQTQINSTKGGCEWAYGQKFATVVALAPYRFAASTNRRTTSSSVTSTLEKCLCAASSMSAREGPAEETAYTER